MITPNIILESSAGYSICGIEDELFIQRKVFLTGPVTTESVDSLFKQLIHLEKLDPEKEITLYINSPGGEVNSGLALYDCIKSIKAPVNTVCIGIAASMGAIIFLAGKTRYMLENSSIMIHDPSLSSGDMSGMKPNELQKYVDRLNNGKEKLCRIIAAESKNDYKLIAEITKEDKYYSADEAINLGFAHKKGGI